MHSCNKKKAPYMNITKILHGWSIRNKKNLEQQRSAVFPKLQNVKCPLITASW